VVVGSGIVPISIGFDQGGSIRFPATMAGLHGLATTYGRVPFNYMLDSTLIKAGPIASNSFDTALAYNVISRRKSPSHYYEQLYDGGIDGSPRPHLSGFQKVNDLSDIRIGIYSAWFNDTLPHIRERNHQVIKYLKSKGITFVEIDIPHLSEISLAHGFKIANEFALAFDPAFHASSTQLQAGTRVTVAIGGVVTALEVLSAEKLRHWAFNYVKNLYKVHKLSAIINPSIGVDVPIFDESFREVGESDTALSVLLMRHISIANFLGLPAYTIPVGYLPPVKIHKNENREKFTLPVGIQLIGDHWNEHKVKI
jgi:Asp-tRNA(Asn)/Glu-tRNA(Gln) amidotransferase A subunit family amidase